MSETTTQPHDLDAQIAVHLFGWRWQDDAQLWRDPEGVYRDAATFRRSLPAYTTDPAATALVWQWLETRGVGLDYLKFAYSPTPPQVRCEITLYHADDVVSEHGGGATWPEALRRPAQALAQALEQGEGER